MYTTCITYLKKQQLCVMPVSGKTLFAIFDPLFWLGCLLVFHIVSYIVALSYSSIKFLCH